MTELTSDERDRFLQWLDEQIDRYKQLADNEEKEPGGGWKARIALHRRHVTCYHLVYSHLFDYHLEREPESLQ